MFHMQLVSLDTADAHVFDAAGPVTPPTAPTPCTILMTVRLPEGKQLTVFVSNLTTQVADDVLTATGKVNIPGQGRDTFIALVKAVDHSDNSIVATISLGSPGRDPLCLVAEVSPLLDTKRGAGAATDYVSGLLNQFLAGRSP